MIVVFKLEVNAEYVMAEDILLTCIYSVGQWIINDLVGGSDVFTNPL